MAIPLPPPQPRRARRSPERLLFDEMRSELVSLLHLGHVRPGDRLPSIRTLAHERRCDHRSVARAYRTLEAEGLVEIRGRSGIFASGTAESMPNSVGTDAVRLVAGVLVEAWQHKMYPADLSSLLLRGLDSSGLCCACVESNRDQMVAYTTEIEAIAGVTALPFYIGPTDRHQVGDRRLTERLKGAIAAVDLVVTTKYHARAVRAAIGTSGVPLVTIRINPELISAVRQHVATSGLTVIAATAEFGDRIRSMYGATAKARDNIRVIIASDAAALRRLDPQAPVLLTRAAQEMLPQLQNVPLVFPHSPTLDVGTLAELSRAIVTVNLRRHAAQPRA